MSSPPPPTERVYVVDRIEQSVAVLIDDRGRTASVPIDRLPAGIGEGVVLRIPATRGALNWSEAMVDRAETERRRNVARQVLEELQERDPGGDVET